MKRVVLIAVDFPAPNRVVLRYEIDSEPGAQTYIVRERFWLYADVTGAECSMQENLALVCMERIARLIRHGYRVPLPVDVSELDFADVDKLGTPPTKTAIS